MDTHQLPVVMDPDDHQRVQGILAELRESSDGSGTISVFLPVSRQVIALVAQDGEIVSWCLMPACDQTHAHTLTALLREVLSCELEIVCRNVKALADVTISRASQAA